MTEGIYQVEIAHARRQPVRQKFLVRGYMLFVNLERFDSPGGSRWSLHRFDRRDYSLIRDGRQAAKATSIERLEKETGIKADAVFLLANPRIAGYVFNPVSFFFCYQDSAHVATIAEVNNTFGEQKHYFIVNEEKPATRQKQFYVSPFISAFHDFRLDLKAPAENLEISINTISGDSIELAAAMRGKRYELTRLNLARLFLRYPFHTLRVILLIHWYALKLLMRRVPFFPKAETDAAIIHSTWRGRQ